ncbi:unnamed protein product [Urochloa decumbens]|uniref:Uncharacterized protein n=1 Tax=Urochloa decumbens TaxID=240449 RepID=A0ABC9EBR7_9POAL
MAEQRGAAREHQPEQPIELAGIFPVPDRRHGQQLCLDAGRALMLSGALLAIPIAFDPVDGVAAADANKRHALVGGFVAWILGVCLCLLGLTPAAAPWAVRAGAAIASTVLKFLSPPV